MTGREGGVTERVPVGRKDGVYSPTPPVAVLRESEAAALRFLCHFVSSSLYYDIIFIFALKRVSSIM